MNKNINILLTTLCLIFLAACTQTEEWDTVADGTGIRVTLTDGVTDIETRATPEELRELAGDRFLSYFRLTATHRETHAIKYTGEYLDNVIPLRAGFYDITATYGDNPVLALDAPYYEGTTENIEVRAKGTTEVTIPCRVANALVSVRYENLEKINATYSNYYVEVGIEGQEDTVHIADTKKSAYFQAGSTPKLTFVGQRSDGGESISIPLTDESIPTTLQAGEHLILTLRMSPEAQLEIGKAEVTTVTVEETLKPEWLPKPKIEAMGFTDNKLTFAETEKKEASLQLNLASALQDLKLTFQFQDPQFAALNERTEGYLLSVPADKEAVETALNITLPNVGDTEGHIDLTPLLAQLQAKTDAATTNTFTLGVKSNNRWSNEDNQSDSTYTLVCNRPQFSIAVQPENVWSKQFTIDEPTVTAGDAEILKEKLIYQYKEKGANENAWQTCSNRLLQTFATHPTNRNYQVRAFYREGIVSDTVNVELEEPTQLPNSGMEEWSTEKGEEFRVSDSWTKKKTYYRFYPYSNGESDIWWATNNQRSQDGNIILGMGHPVCFAPCVSYNEGTKHGGNRSALIYTSGHGGGYTSTGEAIYAAGAIAGNLFIGKYNWSDKTETITQGHTFAVRPTHLKFWYKYVPKNEDVFQAYIELKNGEDLVASGTFEPAASSTESDWTEATITLNYVDSPLKATSIYVRFLSTTKTSFSESDFNRDKSITFPVMGDWNAHIGSMLYIDDISLVYDK